MKMFTIKRVKIIFDEKNEDIQIPVSKKNW